MITDPLGLSVTLVFMYVLPGLIFIFSLIYEKIKTKDKNKKEESYKIVDFDDLIKHIEYKHSNNLLENVQYIDSLVKKINNMVDFETKEKAVHLGTKIKELKYILHDYINLEEWEKEAVLENVFFTTNHIKEETHKTYEEIKAQKTVEVRKHYERKMNDITKNQE